MFLSGVVSPAQQGLISYYSAMGDAAVFIAPALLVAYLAVGGLLLLGVGCEEATPLSSASLMRSSVSTASKRLRCKLGPPPARKPRI